MKIIFESTAFPFFLGTKSLTATREEIESSISCRHNVYKDKRNKQKLKIGRDPDIRTILYVTLSIPDGQTIQI